MELQRDAQDLVIRSRFHNQEFSTWQRAEEFIRFSKGRKRSTKSDGAPRRRPPQNVPPAIQEVHIHNDPTPALSLIYGYGYFRVLIMASFVQFLVYFLLSWRDHLNKSVLRLFRSEERYQVGRSWTGIGDSTRAYVLGNFLLWVFLSSISAIAFFILGVPYWPLIGLLSAFFSLVPYVGLALSILPPVTSAIAIPNRFKIILTMVVITA